MNLQRLLVSISLVFLASIAFTQLAAACHGDGCSGGGGGDLNIVSSPSVSLEYGDSPTVTVKCDASGSHECPSGAYIEVCGDRVSMGNNIRTGGNSYEYRFPMAVPNSFSCGLGTYTQFDYYGPGGIFSDPSYKMTGSGSLRVNAKNMVDPHKADYLAVAADISGTTLESAPVDKLHGFYLTEDESIFNVDIESPGRIVVWDSDLTAGGDDMMDFAVQDGIIEARIGPEINNKYLPDGTEDYNDEAGDADPVREEGFSSSIPLALGYGESRSPSSMSPVHDGNSGYFPEGEILIGYDNPRANVGEVTTSYNNFQPSGSESDVLTVNSDGSVSWDPTQTPNSDDSVTYYYPYYGLKKAEYKFTFSDRGHMRLEFRNENGLVANFNTDARGTNQIWFYCYTCDGASWDSDGDGYDSVATYETGKEYVFEVERKPDRRTTYAILEDGTQIWSHTETHNDFYQTNLESWDSWAGGQTDKPQFTVEEITISGQHRGQNFYICRDGNDGESAVADDSFGNKQRYKCDASSGEWVEVEVCNDGVDNDEDGDADYPEDSGCNSENDDGEGTISTIYCPDAIVGQDSDGDKVAFYGQSDSGSHTDQRTGCSYDYVDDTPQGGDPVSFYCFKDDSQNRLWDSERNNFCKSGIPDNDFNEHGSNQMLAIEYYIPLHAIPYGTTYASGIGDYDPDSGFDNNKHQSIHDAEEKYDTGDSLTCDGPCHDKTIWDNKNLTNTDGYSTGDTDAIENAWIESNATGYGTPGIQNTGDPNDQGTGWINDTDAGIWPGGFAGNCPTGQTWKYYDSEWQCTGSLNTDQEVFLPDMSQDSSKAGFFVLPYFFYGPLDPRQDIESYYAAGGDTYLDRLDAKCWKGGSSTKYADASSNSKFSLTINNLPRDPSVPVPVVDNMNHDGTFTCSWNYTDANNKDVSDVGNLVQLDSSEFSTRASNSADLALIDYNDSGQKLTDTVDSSTLGTIAQDWKNTLGVSYN